MCLYAGADWQKLICQSVEGGAKVNSLTSFGLFCVSIYVSDACIQPFLLLGGIKGVEGGGMGGGGGVKSM